ncbi:MAG: secretin N-terminal domain-containing protein [Chlamydiota bacterium]|nr:secretin N-terminal domain-containing protein [Chlamydiota bacterium]
MMKPARNLSFIFRATLVSSLLTTNFVLPPSLLSENDASDWDASTNNFLIEVSPANKHTSLKDQFIQKKPYADSDETNWFSSVGLFEDIDQSPEDELIALEDSDEIAPRNAADRMPAMSRERRLAQQERDKEAARERENQKTILINFNNVQIVELIRFISKISNKNFYFNEEELNFNVTIISEEMTTIENVLMALFQELRIHDFDLIEQGDNIIIHQNPSIKAPGAVKAESLPDTLTKDADIVTQVFRLNTANASNVATMIQPILSANSIVEVLEDTNHIIITDINGNIIKISQLIKSIDAPNSSLIIGQYVVRNAFTDTLITNAELIMQSVAPGQSITFVEHKPSNSIFIVSTPFLVERTIPILQRLDQTDGVTGIYNLDELKYIPEELVEPGDVIGPTGVMTPEGTQDRVEIGPNGEIRLVPTPGSISYQGPSQKGRWRLDSKGNWYYEPEEGGPGKLLGNPKMLVGPDGKPALGPNGKPLFYQNGPDGKPIYSQIGIDGRPVYFNDGQLLLGPKGQPILGPDGKPFYLKVGNQILGPNGRPILGPDGEPIIFHGSLTKYTTPQLLLGPDGNPVIGPNGKPLIIQYGRDKKPIYMQTGPDGKPVPFRDGELILGPDGEPIYGPNGRPFYVRSGSPIIGPDGKPLVGPDGNQLIFEGDQFDPNRPPEGTWSQDLQGNWQFNPGKATSEGELSPDIEPESPEGYWELGQDGKWRFMLTPGESIFAKKSIRAASPTAGLPLGHIERTKFLIHKLNYRLGGAIEAAILKIGDSMRDTEAVNEDLIATINSVQWLEASNSLIFTGTPESLLKVKELVEEIDQPLRQVFIEMLILETSVDDSLNYSVNFGNKFRNDDGDLAGAQAFQSGASVVTSVLDSGGVTGTSAASLSSRLPDTSPFISNQAGYSAGIIGQSISVGNLCFNSLTALVRAVHSKSDANIVMNPKIITEDNVTAEIFVGLNTRFKTQSVSNDEGSIITNNFEFRDVGTTLRVTPLLGPSNIITLQIEEEVSNVVGGTAGTDLTDSAAGPTTRINRTSTQVHIPNNNFLVLSGMVQDQVERTRSHVPCLGGAPLIGAAFTGKSYVDQKRCLMIFIRPQIVDTIDEMDHLTKHQQNIYRVKRRTKKMWKLDCEEALDWMNLKETDTNNDERKCCEFRH